jgi:DNA-binding CsgD family transcriptional regulator
MSIFQPANDARNGELSAREREVLVLIARGATNREIAATLHLSPHTVKGHASSLYRKLDAKNRAEAVQRAQRFGLEANPTDGSNPRQTGGIRHRR